VLVCLLLTLPGLPALFKGWLEQGRHLAGAADFAAIVASGRVSLPIAAAVAIVSLSGLLLLQRRRDRARQVRRLARQGRPVAAIARRTRLAQDVVRDLLGSDAETAANDRDFGDLLQASAMLPGA